MRRAAILAILVFAVIAGGAYWLATRPLVVGRAVGDAPPFRIERPTSRIGQPAPVFTAVDQNGRRASWPRGRVSVVAV